MRLRRDRQIGSRRWKLCRAGPSGRRRPRIGRLWRCSVAHRRRLWLARRNSIELAERRRIDLAHRGGSSLARYGRLDFAHCWRINPAWGRWVRRGHLHGGRWRCWRGRFDSARRVWRAVRRSRDRGINHRRSVVPYLASRASVPSAGDYGRRYRLSVAVSRRFDISAAPLQLEENADSDQSSQCNTRHRRPKPARNWRICFRHPERRRNLRHRRRFKRRSCRGCRARRGKLRPGAEPDDHASAARRTAGRLQHSTRIGGISAICGCLRGDRLLPSVGRRPARRCRTCCRRPARWRFDQHHAPALGARQNLPHGRRIDDLQPRLTSGAGNAQRVHDFFFAGVAGRTSSGGSLSPRFSAAARVVMNTMSGPPGAFGLIT